MFKGVGVRGWMSLLALHFGHCNKVCNPIVGNFNSRQFNRPKSLPIVVPITMIVISNCRDDPFIIFIVELKI